jgi:hypothetical protein
MGKFIEKSYSLYLLVLTVRDISDTGTQSHLLFYLLMYGLYIVQRVNNILIILV